MTGIVNKIRVNGFIGKHVYLLYLTNGFIGKNVPAVSDCRGGATGGWQGSGCPLSFSKREKRKKKKGEN